jgi:pimeloyl-ACP methyl ester carboxylesterase
MPGENRQFQILHRDFLSRMVDLELVSAGGDTRDIVTRFGALLGSLSVIIAYLMVPRYLTSGMAHDKLARLAWGDEEFLLSATIALSGLCAVLTWNNVFPDKRDSLVLGLLPVRMKTMILARFAAIATVLLAVIAAMNVVTGISFPFVLSNGFFDAIARFATWWLTLVAAGAFTFCTALAAQGVAAQILPWRVFLRVSGLLQIAALFTVLAFFFLAPPFDSATPPGFIPSFWFVGLLHAMRGDTAAPMPTLAGHALVALGIVIPLAVLVYVLSWTRNMRRIVESPDILPAKNPRIANALARRLTPQPFARAILQFTARTITRSRQHRLMLAIYGGFGLALSIAFARTLLENGTRFTTTWDGPSTLFLLVTGILVLSCIVVGVRTVFVFPFALRSNWIFRITAVHHPSAYFAAVRRALYATAALPMLVLLGIWYLAIWPGRPSIGHVILLTIFAMVLVERSLYQFRKIPFTCSWLPGGGQRSLKRGIWGLVFLFFVDMLAGIEYWNLGKPARLILVAGILGAVAIRSRMRTTEFAKDPFNTVQFEESPQSEIFALDLRQDGAWLGEQAYVDAIDANFGRSLAQRARPFAIGFAMVLLAGFCYEQVWEWKDRRDFPQVGHSVDIGGRSLNIYCSGSGSPAVIFDSGSGQPGYSWILVQPHVAAVTRACWYDRAGYGWSDPLWEPRASADIANDLHKLLRAAGVPPPYVLVGHSFGGFNVRVYANRYPQEVSGMVLVDSADEFEGTVEASALETDEPPLEWRVAARAADFLFHFGLGRLIVDDSNPPSLGLPSRHDSALINSVEFQQRALIATLWESRGRSAAQVQAIRTLGSMPLIVLTAAATKPPPGSEMARVWAAHMRNRVYGTQARLAALSTRGRQIILNASSHDIPFDDPEAIVKATDEVLRVSRTQ